MVRLYLASLHDQKKSVFLEGWIFSSQSELFESECDAIPL